MAWDQIADAEEGDETDWDSVTENGSSTLDAHADAKKNGDWGWKVIVVDNTAYGSFTDPANETEVTAEIQFDVNSLAMGTSNAPWLLQLTGDAGATVTSAIIRLIESGGNYQIDAGLYNDSSAFSSTPNVTITDDYHLIRIAWKASTGPGNDDGFLHLYIDGVLEESLTGLDNDTYDVDTIKIGLVAARGTTTGICYFDDCRWHDMANVWDTPAAITAVVATTAPTVRERVQTVIASAIAAVVAPQVRERVQTVIASAIAATTAGYVYIRHWYAVLFRGAPTGIVQFGPSEDADDDNVMFEGNPKGNIKEQ